MSSSKLVQADTPYLFLYGTLMPGASGRLGRARRDRLAVASENLGPATISGRLYDLGLYPGVILDSSTNEHVFGEVVRLLDPDAVFRWLDRYEGVMERGVSRFNFERSTTSATLAAGEALLAWVYHYRGPAIPEKQVKIGCWSNR